jgi:hypothetical protein
MGTKVWNFFLPESGAHQIRVEMLGVPGQRVYIDGELQQATEAMIFTGPQNTLLELRCQDKHRWVLMINGYVVEDYNPGRRKNGDETIRELRGKADGSYLIAPSFEVPELELHIVRRFRFRAGHELHELSVAHSDCIWQVVCDGALVARECHRMKDNSGEVSFNIQVAPELEVYAALQMSWVALERKWRYVLTVNHVDVPAYWVKGQEPLEVDPVVVLAELPAPPPSPEAAQLMPREELRPAGDESLPQGVSFNTASGCYEANIRNKAGKFLCLGEFRTADEAHAKYVEALPVYCPERCVLPGIPP